MTGTDPFGQKTVLLACFLENSSRFFIFSEEEFLCYFSQKSLKNGILKNAKQKAIDKTFVFLYNNERNIAQSRPAVFFGGGTRKVGFTLLNQGDISNKVPSTVFTVPDKNAVSLRNILPRNKERKDS